ncbi:MAG: hypothetical protein FWD92_02960 [Methanomassiliicoccaceae archaeon]|nr:hypothetical protein [Methanomassiliicoccaceae archaeon]
MASFDALGKDSSLFALIMGIIAVAVIYFPLAVLLMGVLAFVIGLINLLGNKHNLVALIAMVLGLIVILLAVLDHI